MRPRKTRIVQCLPQEKLFRPQCSPISRLEHVCLTIDEYEAIRLSWLNGMRQEAAAKIMRISRPTFSRMVTSAQKKLADALVNIKYICIEGGCCCVREDKK